MQGEGIIAGVIGVLGGGAGRHFFGRLWGPERKRLELDVAAKRDAYYRQVITELEEENEGLRDRLHRAEERIDSLEAAVQKITAGELPPEYS